MSKQIEAMKRWVEVFDGNWHDEPVDSEWADRAHQSLTEMRQAIAEAEQPAQQEPVLWQILNGVCHAGVRSTENLAKEAAAGMQKTHDLGGSLAAFHVRPLYTTPQAQPLTDDKYEAIVEDIADWNRYVEVDTAHQSLEKHVREVLTAHGITKGNT